MENERVECKSKEGLTSGLIDSIGYIAHTLSERDFEHQEIKESLIDLGENEYFKALLTEIQKATNGKN